MSEASDRIMDGLKDTRAYLNGKHDDFMVHEDKVPDPDIATIQAKCRCRRPRAVG